MQRISDHSATAAWITLAILGLIVLFAAVRLLWLGLGGPQLPALDPLPVPRIAALSSPASERAWTLFGEDTRAAPMGIPANVRQTPLALKLRGTVATGDQGGYAVIMDESGDEDVYRKGDELPGGAEVVSVEPRRVLLLRDGQTEALELPRESLGDGSPDGSRSRRAAPARTVSMPGIRGMNGSGGATSIPALSSNLGLDTAALANSITVMPVRGGGFRVRPGRDAELFRELGLHANDIVTAVNGQSLQSPADVQKIFQQVQQSGQVSITVRRQGRERVLTPDLSALNID